MNADNSLESLGSAECARAGELLLESWQADLPAAERLWLTQHIASCAACAAIETTWRELDELPQATPSSAQRQRFEAMLAAELQIARPPAAEARPRWWRQSGWHIPSPVWALAVLSLALGLGGGWWLRGARTAPAPAPTDQSKEIAALRQEVHTTGELVVLSLLQQQSASERLRGVNWSYRLSTPDPRVTDALLGSLNNDPSPDVRLAALEALQQIATPDQNSPLGGQVRRDLVASFQHQKSPLLQIALVDSFIDTHDTAARALLESVRADAQYRPEVRQRAEWGLTQWN